MGERIVAGLIGAAAIGLAIYIMPAWFVGIVIGVPLLTVGVAIACKVMGG